MTIQDAVSIVKSHAVGGYMLSDDVYQKTIDFHNGDDERFWEVCKSVASSGVVIVDNCMEEAYRIFNNHDHDGQDESGNDFEVMISTITSNIETNVRNKTGRLMKLGCVFGVLSK